MKKNKVIKMNGFTNEERQEEEESIGLIRRDEPKLIPCQCNNCGAIFLMKNGRRLSRSVRTERSWI